MSDLRSLCLLSVSLRWEEKAHTLKKEMQLFDSSASFCGEFFAAFVANLIARSTLAIGCLATGTSEKPLPPTMPLWPASIATRCPRAAPRARSSPLHI